MPLPAAALPQTVVTSGRNLFAIAAQVYGDATLANLLAQANGMNDPFPQGVVTLTIPPLNAALSGGLPVS